MHVARRCHVLRDTQMAAIGQDTSLDDVTSQTNMSDFHFLFYFITVA